MWLPNHAQLAVEHSRRGFSLGWHCFAYSSDGDYANTCVPQRIPHVCIEKQWYIELIESLAEFCGMLQKNKSRDFCDRSKW